MVSRLDMSISVPLLSTSAIAFFIDSIAKCSKGESPSSCSGFLSDNDAVKASAVPKLPMGYLRSELIPAATAVRLSSVVSAMGEVMLSEIM